MGLCRVGDGMGTARTGWKDQWSDATEGEPQRTEPDPATNHEKINNQALKETDRSGQNRKEA